MRDSRIVVDVEATPLHDRAAAETYVASVCFKHGPPRLLGVELEWTVHHANDPRRYVDAQHLGKALGAHAPTTLVPDSPHIPLPDECLVTVEPGGQVEISSPPRHSLTELFSVVRSDASFLARQLAGHGLTLGQHGLDPHRAPKRLLRVPRYAAMEAAFEPIGPDGIGMMCSTAGIQVCVDVGEPGQAAARWAALHMLGPVLSALFANSLGQRQHARWVSARMRTLFGTDPARMRPSAVNADPAASWARRVLDVPLVCVRRPNGRWEVPGRITFADWIAGALPGRPTTDDLDYHLSTLFPPVRPRGYLEVRYLDTQPDTEWVVPSALLVALLANEATVDAALAAAAPAAGRWLVAARYGLADPRLAAAARKVVELGCGVMLTNTDLDDELATSVVDRLERRMAAAIGGAQP